MYVDDFMRQAFNLAKIAFNADEVPVGAIVVKEGRVNKGDFVIHTASMPIADMGMTNMLKLSQI